MAYRGRTELASQSQLERKGQRASKGRDDEQVL
jgi:hypothetical protein